jgi:hypothetical protein
MPGKATRTALHLTASMRAVKAHGHAARLPDISATKRKVLKAAEETSDPDLLALRARLGRACGRLRPPTAAAPVERERCRRSGSGCKAPLVRLSCSRAKPVV